MKTEVSTGTILYEKNMHDIHYPASITKIMAALLAMISEDKAYFEEMMKKENPIFENSFISKFDADNSYVIIPKGLDVSDLNIKFDYGGAETVTAQYFYEDHLVGQVDFTVEGIQSESDSLGNVVREPLSQKKESKRSLFNWKYIIFAIIVGVLVAVVFIKVALEKYRSKNRKNRLGRRPKRKGVRTRWR